MLLLTKKGLKSAGNRQKKKVSRAGLEIFLYIELVSDVCNNNKREVSSSTLHHSFFKNKYLENDVILYKTYFDYCMFEKVFFVLKALDTIIIIKTFRKIEREKGTVMTNS